MRPTYACFIDLRKAFDRDPHEALFRKLESLGIRGRCLELYRWLYRSLWTQVILPLHYYSICLSMIYLNNVDHLVFEWLVGLPESTMVGSTENRLPGLILHAQDKVRRRQWQLQGKDIPVVEEYRYLGIDLNCNLDEGFTVRRQIQRYRQKLHMATPFLRNVCSGALNGVHMKHTGDAGHVYGPKDLVCVHGLVNCVNGYLHFGKVARRAISRYIKAAALHSRAVDSQ
ncbi:hypothetical protein GAYE_SCF46G5779 [Galdieria yellowstonensis]|uniref:Reverse transcriptase domain-containing protein n=1 Tax=Galdieria yellowstonensis TaxID=3028027 RepID=A0AAV9IK97_9RHOD|nr:hypothetical protein GAYE_SCF46G5779 [Galdieria yellowstonensis]